MRFYDILQLDAQANKNLMNNSSENSDKKKLRIGIFCRSFLLVLFAVLFITTLTTLFGSENTPMAVVIFCILLGVRFVDFGYCIKDEMLTLCLVFLILLVSPVISATVFPLFGFVINLISLFTIFFFTCDKPEMGNGGLFSFAYIYLFGNPVYDEVLIQRFFLTLTGFVICGIVFYFKHKDKNTEIRLSEKVKQLRTKDFKFQWLLKLSVGISGMLFLGVTLNIDRVMWAGFACASLLSIYSPCPKLKERVLQRIIGVIIGVIIFFVIYSLLPTEFHGIIGIFGGFILGFCIEYQHKTAMNCLGALLIASETYGLHYSIFLRITNTIIGLIFGFAFLYVCEKSISKKFT